MNVARGCKRFILIRARILIPSGLGVEGCVETEESRGANIVGKDGGITVRKKNKMACEAEAHRPGGGVGAFPGARLHVVSGALIQPGSPDARLTARTRGRVNDEYTRVASGFKLSHALSNVSARESSLGAPAYRGRG